MFTLTNGNLDSLESVAYSKCFPTEATDEEQNAQSSVSSEAGVDNIELCSMTSWSIL